MPGILLVCFGFATQLATPCAVFVDSSFAVHGRRTATHVVFWMLYCVHGGQSTVLYPEVSVWLENSDTFIDDFFFRGFSNCTSLIFFATALNHKQVFYIVSESFLKPENTVLTPKKKGCLNFFPYYPKPSGKITYLSFLNSAKSHWVFIVQH